MKQFIIFLTILILGVNVSGWDRLPSRTADDPSFTYTASPDDWRDYSIYQIFTDRFNDGNSGNNASNGNYDPSGVQSVHGGDFKGIEEKLDYIKMLGMSAIWISPVARNRPGTPHGYWPDNFGQIDPHWGSLQDLRDLVDAAHARGIMVIIDVIANHMADLIDSSDGGFPSFKYPDSYNKYWENGSGDQYPAPFNNLDLFYMHGTIVDFNNDTELLYGDFPLTDSLNTERSDVRGYIREFFQDLIAATDCDGFRVDTARLVDMGAWEEIMPGVRSYAHSIGKENFITFCEAGTEDSSKLGSYTQPYTHSTYGTWPRFNSALNFALAAEFERVFFHGYPTANLTGHHTTGGGVLDHYGNEARYQLANFFDNHDRARALSSSKLNGSWDRLKVALAFHLSTLQIPIIYYGTEQAFNGENDPYNREDMFDGAFEQGGSDGDNFNYTHPLYIYTRKLMLLKNTYTQLRRGNFTQRWEDSDSQGLYVFSRDYNSLGEVIVAINTAYSEEWVSGAETAYAYNTELANLLNENERVTVGQNVDANHKINFSVPGYGVKIWFNAAYIQPLPPIITAQSPTQGSTGVSRLGEVSLTFDQAMNKSTTKEAFSISPSVSGTFSWSNGDTVMTFTPSDHYPATTTCSVNLNSTATAANSKEVGAVYKSYFKTGTTPIDTDPVQISSGSPEVSVFTGNQNVPGENFDLQTSGGAAYTTDQGSFGTFGSVYFNYDSSGLYIGSKGCDPGGNDKGLVLFLGLNTLSDNKGTLWDNTGEPNSLDLMHNIAFTKDMDIALVLGDEWGDGNMGSFMLGNGYDFGQGIFYLSANSFVAVPGSMLAQYDGSGTTPVEGNDDDGNRLTDRWEAFISWSNLGAVGLHSVTQLYVAGVIADDSISGNDRYLSGNVLASQVSGNLNQDNDYGFNFLTITPIDIDVSLNQLDSDNDGMPDVYENEHGLNPNDETDAIGDKDNDGFLNWKEYTAGTDPNIATSLLWISSAILDNQMTNVLRWPSAQGKAYDVQRSGELISSNYTVLSTGIPATPPENVYTDIVNEVEVQYFYRIRLNQ